MLVTKHPECASRAKLLRSHGMTTMSYQRAEGHATTYDVTEPGYNYRMDDLRASLGLAQLDRVLPDLAARAKIRERYLQRLSGSKGVTVPFASHKQFTSNYIFTVAFPNTDSSRRDEIRALMAEAGIQTSMHYPPVHQFSFYKEF